MLTSKIELLIKKSVAFLSDFFFIFCPQNLGTFADVPIKSTKQFLYYTEFTCRMACAQKFKSEFHVFDRFQASKIWILFLKMFCGAILEIIFR